MCVCAHVSVCVFVSLTSPGVVVRRHSVCGLDIRVEGGLEVEQVTGEIWHAGETRAERDRDKNHSRADPFRPQGREEESYSGQDQPLGALPFSHPF